MFIKNFGQFWRADEVDWYPGRGNRDTFMLLGRRGKNRPTLRLADFRHQQGIYILYGNHGPHYTGQTKKQGLGKRLKDHLTDHHKGCWDRFSWFGFQQVKKNPVESGLCELRELASSRLGNPHKLISDVEALLIRAMGLTNIAQTQFCEAEEWHQVKGHESQIFLERVADR